MQRLVGRLPPRSSPFCPTSRAYAVSITPPLVYPKKPAPRIYSERKAYLYNQYIRLLQTSSYSPLIFLQHDKFSIPRLTKLRKDIAAAALHDKNAFASSLLNPGPTHFAPNADPAINTPPSLTILRTSIFGAALRDYAPLDARVTEEIANAVKGGLAVLSLSSLDPPQLNDILRALHRSAPFPQTKSSSASDSKPAKEKDDSDFVPGRRSKRVKPIQTPELTLMGALIEGRVFKMLEVQNIASLPTLDSLRQQILGLISSPATQLAAVLSQASGGQLARTLEGFRKSLEEGEEADAGS